MAPSPSSSLNTPAGMIGGTTHSPVQDEQISQACREKIQKLRKYIEPLNRAISKLTNDGCKSIIVSFSFMITRI